MSDGIDPIEERTLELEARIEQQDVLGLRKIIERGMDAEAFMRTPLGRYIVAKANADLEDARDAFLNVDPMDAKAVMHAQMQALIPARVITWLGDAVDEGKASQTQFIEADAAARG